MEQKNSNLIDGRAIAASLFSDITKRVGQLEIKPLLCDVVVGSDPVSLSYVKIKQKRALECGMEFSLVELNSDVSDDEVISVIENEQTKPNLCGLIVQLPLPPELDEATVLSAIGANIDVDGINPNSEHKLVPPTAGAIVHILDSLNLDLQSQKIVVIGNGNLVGKPVRELLNSRGLEVATVLEDTANRAELIKNATIIISGVGKAGILTGEDVSEGVVVIDAGTSEQGGSISGDVDFKTVAPMARFITPSPGGVGPVTVAKLLENVLLVAEQK